MSDRTPRMVLWMTLGPMAFVCLASVGYIANAMYRRPEGINGIQVVMAIVLVLLGGGTCTLIASTRRPWMWIWSSLPTLLMSLGTVAVALAETRNRAPRSMLTNPSRFYEFMGPTVVLSFLLMYVPMVLAMRGALGVLDWVARRDRARGAAPRP